MLLAHVFQHFTLLAQPHTIDLASTCDSSLLRGVSYAVCVGFGFFQILFGLWDLLFHVTDLDGRINVVVLVVTPKVLPFVRKVHQLRIIHDDFAIMLNCCMPPPVAPMLVRTAGVVAMPPTVLKRQSGTYKHDGESRRTN